MLQIFIILAIAIFGFVLYKVALVKKVKDFVSDPQGKVDEDNITGTLSDYDVCELDDKGNIVQEVPLDQKKCDTKEGFSIGRNKNCDFVIKRKSNFVGGIHARVGRDEDGYFVMDNESKNHMYVQGKPVSSFGVCDKVLYLADTPMWFRKNEHNFAVEAPNKGEEDESCVEEKKEEAPSPFGKPLHR